MAHVANITINNAQVAGDLTDFPVYVDLADLPNSFWNVVANGGGDIRVFKADGTTELAREVVTCNTGTKTGELHFKFSGTLSGSTDTIVQIHADGTSSDYAVTDTYGRNNVWTEVQFVYHLQSNGNNSTSASGNGTVANVTFESGQVGDAGRWPNTDWNNGRITIPNQTAPSSWAISASFNRLTYPGGEVFSGSESGSVYYKTINQSATSITGIYSIGVNNHFVAHNMTVPENTWLRTVWVFDGSVGSHGQFRLLVDGDEKVTNSPTGAVSSRTGDSVIGSFAYNFTASQGGRRGLVDEVRVYAKAPSNNWFLTEHNNLSSPSTFYTALSVGNTGAFFSFF
jgi:hypothetical protein